MEISQGRALRDLRTSFEHAAKQMEGMHPECRVKPSDGNVILPRDEMAGVGIEVKCTPVVCRVPERASHQRASLYVVLTGWISFQSGTHDGQLLTKSYGTNFAYFSVQGDAASHVLGGHYDFAPNERAHPRAHMQLRSHVELYVEVQRQFRSLAGIQIVKDLMDRVLTRARPPTAQMDFLGFLLQVSADHLVDEKSTDDVVSTFERLSEPCAPIRGYNSAVEHTCDCHRSSHWYPQRTHSSAQATRADDEVGRGTSA